MRRRLITLLVAGPSLALVLGLTTDVASQIKPLAETVTQTFAESAEAAAPAPAVQAKSSSTAKSKYATHLKNAKALPVKGRAPKTGYDRDKFGPAWSDAAGSFKWTKNGCSTRDDLLNRDLVKKTHKPGTRNCVVLKGILPVEPYLGTKNRPFDRSKGTSGSHALDAEHTVALADAWVKGAQQWDAKKRAAFANDPRNLIAVDPGQNRAKGDKDAATWLPKNKAYRCTYIAKQVNVKTIYGLWVTKAEKDAMVSILSKR